MPPIHQFNEARQATFMDCKLAAHFGLFTSLANQATY
jgi:hypothetical protein